MNDFEHLITAESMECPIWTRAVSDPDSAAIRSGERTVSYRQLDRLIQEKMGSLSIKPGDRVCFQPQPTIEHVVFFWALFRKHAVACPVSKREPESVAISRARQVSGSWLPDIGDFASENGDDYTSQNSQLKLNGAATIIFSSGSTAEPKAVVHDLRAHVLSAIGSNENIPLEPGDGWLLSLPTCHVGGLAILFRCALAGACVVLPEPNGTFGEWVSNPRVTHVSVVTTQLLRLLRDPKMKTSHLKTVLLGGSALPKELVRSARRKNLPIRTTYGMTEMASQVTTSRSSQNDDINAGSLLRYRRLEVDADGEILVAGPTLCLGYWLEGRLLEVTESDGWFRTGDIGKLAQSSLTVTGRMDNMFISGGENIHPEEIESILLNFPGVRQAVVVPIAHKEYGLRPVAVLDTDSIDQENILQFLRLDLPSYKLPDSFLPWPPDRFNTGLKPGRSQVSQYVADMLG